MAESNKTTGMCSGESGGLIVFSDFVTKLWGWRKEFQRASCVLFSCIFHFRLRRKECLGPYFGILHIHASNGTVVRPQTRVSRSCIALHDHKWWFCKSTKSQRRLNAGE